ncbi:hypothetical protein N7G274_010823 [Stereocaulon virgatum]|uniref:L-ornithine N(5)-oxygenase n=1 Tax=Stereocaulon virgatum TaxID=373712 RepID=A0ABR3ZV19_9LECA
MASRPIPNSVDTVIVGNGPSALILSYILHGNIPYYNPAKAHPDPMLHAKLSQSPCLLDVDIADLTTHFAASRLSYSTQALPVNVLLDTLLRPLADTDPGEYTSCVEWRLEEDRRVQHVVLGNTPQAGGQWADNPVSASWNIGTLSYSEMLSLPGYTFDDHYREIQGGELPDFYRPPRREVAAYIAAYPAVVGIANSIYTDEEVQDIGKVDDGFHIDSHNIFCKHLVLASGIFSSLIPPRPILRPLSTLLEPNPMHGKPLLVVGSGFTAADVIISTPPTRKILHIFKWDPENNPSPLRACHPRAYPEYASVYRRMKLAAQVALGPQGLVSPMRIKRPNPFFKERDWDKVYEGLPNTFVKRLKCHNSSALLTLETANGHTIQREISNMEYVIGRRGSLGYLGDNIAKSIGTLEDQTLLNKALISGQTLRRNVEQSLEVAPNVFVIGSLTGDSLIRFAYGGCVFTAREIMRSNDSKCGTPNTTPRSSCESLSTAPSSTSDLQLPKTGARIAVGGHPDLHLDKRARTYTSDQEAENCEMWPDPWWWYRGCVVS